MRVVVLGGGPGGYVCAIRLAQLGAEVLLIEKGELGGTCLNVGCIPTKALLHAAEIYNTVNKEGLEYGIQTDSVTIDWHQTQKKKAKVVAQLVDGVEGLMLANKIAVLRGTGVFQDGRTMKIEMTDHTTQSISFDFAVIASGSRPKIPPIPGADLPGILTSTEALSLSEIPESLCVIGGGVIGCELAQVYASFGTEVTILEALPDILFGMDKDIVKVLKRQFGKTGIKCNLNAAVKKIEQSGAGFKIEYGGGVVEASQVLIATGRAANVEGIGLEKAGVQVENGVVTADPSTTCTNIPHIYAIGDCTGGIQLAHVASAQGVLAAEQIMGMTNRTCFHAVPSGVYTTPELGSVGLTEQEAIDHGYDVKVGKFPFAANGKAIISGENTGVVKMVVDAESDAVLGLHIAGPRATDLVEEGALAISMEATTEEIINTIHGHPTLCEAIHEAAHAVHNQAFHIPN
ncbi:dihydrolipoyl dehydrogenase [Ruminococcaceae bacterium OttesenSCG-928-I18]|nr:dihydrolipoyl dehydrogenase [Ruminococcaceae bacterium OttesenSCG-928-I18]